MPSPAGAGIIAPPSMDRSPAAHNFSSMKFMVPAPVPTVDEADAADKDEIEL